MNEVSCEKLKGYMKMICLAHDGGTRQLMEAA